MNDSALHLLQLDPESIGRKVTFHTAYATTCVRESNQLLQQADRELRPEVALRNEQHLFEAASSLRKAAGWALLLDDERAAELVAAAADMYLALNFGFGLFLAEAVGIRSSLYEEQSRALLRAIADLQSQPHTDDGDSEQESRFDVPDPMRRPQQQAYAAVAVAATPNARQLVAGIAQRSSQRQGLMPVGALGTPIWRFWAVADALTAGDLVSLLSQIEAMSQRFSDYAESAMINRGMWRNGYAEFEPVDLDIVGLTLLACRRFGQSEVAAASERDNIFGRSLGLSQLGIAMSVFEWHTNRR